MNYNNHTDMSPTELLKEINDKCIKTLGYKTINSISSTQNNKTTVLFLNGNVKNFCSYGSAFEHLNISYNLKLSRKKPKVIKHIDITKANVSNIEIPIKNLKTLIQKFQLSGSNIKLNKIVISDYLLSAEWKKYRLMQSENDEIIGYLSSIMDLPSRQYVHYIDKILKRNSN